MDITDASPADWSVIGRNSKLDILLHRLKAMPPDGIYEIFTPNAIGATSILVGTVPSTDLIFVLNLATKHMTKSADLLGKRESCDEQTTKKS